MVFNTSVHLFVPLLFLGNACIPIRFFSRDPQVYGDVYGRSLVCTTQLNDSRAALMLTHQVVRRFNYFL